MAQRIGGRTGRMLDALGYYRKTPQIGHGTAYTQVRTLWGIPGISRPVKYECEGGIRQIQLLKNPETPIGTLKRMIKAIISGKAKIERWEVPEAEEAFSDIEARHPELKGLIQEARNKLPAKSARQTKPARPIKPATPPAPDTIEEAVEPAEAPSVARGAAPPPPPAEEEVPEEDVPVLNVSQVSRLEVLGEADDADTVETHPPVDENAVTQEYAGRSRPQVDEDAPTTLFKVGGSKAETVVREVTPEEIEAQTAPEPKEEKVLFTSVTKILELTPEEEKVVQDAELMEGAFKSILRKLTSTAEVQSTRAAELETELKNLRAEKEAEAKAIAAFVGETEEDAKATITAIFNDEKKFPIDIASGKILDHIEQKYPKLARRVKTLRSLLQGGNRDA